MKTEFKITADTYRDCGNGSLKFSGCYTIFRSRRITSAEEAAKEIKREYFEPRSRLEVLNVHCKEIKKEKRGDYHSLYTGEYAQQLGTPSSGTFQNATSAVNNAFPLWNNEDLEAYEIALQRYMAAHLPTDPTCDL